MDTTLLDEIIACLPKGKTHFRYFAGGYVPKLLGMLPVGDMPVRDLKKTRFARFLDNPIIKPLLANSGNGYLHKTDLQNLWREPSLPFLLSVDRWDGRKNRAWNQVSRLGENLVLQLNMSNQHSQLFKQWVSPEDEYRFNYDCGHPVQSEQNNTMFRDTLAWARIDLDFDNNEALIEEIQSDAVRNIADFQKQFLQCGCSVCKTRLKYMNWFKPYAKCWTEAILIASIWFIKQELGIEHIYMHTARSGWKVKNMDKGWLPPKSLYSDLPRKFAFKQTWAAPEFLLKTKSYQRLIRKQPDIDFYKLSFNEERGGYYA